MFNRNKENIKKATKSNVEKKKIIIKNVLKIFLIFLQFKGGKFNGLCLKIMVPYLDELKYFYSFTSALGAHIFISNQSVNPTIFDGFDISVDKETNVVVKREFSKR